jgi:hypothetical protein
LTIEPSAVQATYGPLLAMHSFPLPPELVLCTRHAGSVSNDEHESHAVPERKAYIVLEQPETVMERPAVAGRLKPKSEMVGEPTKVYLMTCVQVSICHACMVRLYGEPPHPVCVVSRPTNAKNDQQNFNSYHYVEERKKDSYVPLTHLAG